MGYWPSCALTGFIFLLGIFNSGFPKVQSLDYEIDIERAEKIFGDEETLIDIDWKVHRKGKDHLISGTTNITQDLDNSFTRTVEAEYSASGNKYFTKTPFKLAKLPICDFFNTSYKKFIEPSYIGRSNFSIIPPEGLCPIPQGFYYIKDVTFREVPNLPQHIEPGVWKLTDKYLRGNKLIGGVFLIVRAHSKIYV